VINAPRDLSIWSATDFGCRLLRRDETYFVGVIEFFAQRVTDLEVNPLANLRLSVIPRELKVEFARESEKSVTAEYCGNGFNACAMVPWKLENAGRFPERSLARRRGWPAWPER